jgi:lipooligosaccharide transport system permease protein
VIGAVKWQRQYHAMIAAPLTVGEVLAGHAAFVLLRVLFGAVAFVAVGALLGAFATWWVMLTIPVAVLCGAVHALPVMGFAVLVESDNSFNMVFRFGVVPMFLFAGTFFPIDQLPVWMQPLAWAAPLWHCTELCRDLALSRAELGPAVGHLAYLGAWLVLGTLYAVRRYRRRLSE